MSLRASFIGPLRRNPLHFIDLLESCSADHKGLFGRHNRSSSARKVQVEELLKGILRRNISRPIVRRRYRAIQVCVCVDQPLWSFVIQLRQRALAQLHRGHGVLRKEAIGITRRNLRLSAHQVGRVEPRIAQLVQPLRSLRNCNCARILGELLRWNIRRQAVRKRERSRKWLLACSAGRYRLRARCPFSATRSHENASAKYRTSYRHRAQRR